MLLTSASDEPTCWAKISQNNAKYKVLIFLAVPLLDVSKYRCKCIGDMGDGLCSQSKAQSETIQILLLSLRTE